MTDSVITEVACAYLKCREPADFLVRVTFRNGATPPIEHPYCPFHAEYTIALTASAAAVPVDIQKLAIA